jgi:hypothetical protein
MNISHERTNGKEEWLTPKFIIENLCKFDLDPCSPQNPPFKIADKIYTEKENGLLQNWEGLVFCNPPYGNKTIHWIKKAADHKKCICLIFARTDTKLFQDIIFKNATSILFIKGRLKFLNIKGEETGTAGAPSCLISFNFETKEILKNSGIKGKFMEFY